MRRITSLLLLLVVAVSYSGMAQAKAKKKAPAPAPSRHEAPAEPVSEEPRKRHVKQSLHDTATGQGYGTAGCGLGSIVFGPKPGIIQVVAATLNGIGGQTFGITTGTSNCDIPEMGYQAAAFIEINREVLVKEAARGEGETVAGLAHLMNCSDSKSFGRKLQQNYSQIFSPEKNSFDTTRAILSTIENDSELKPLCPSLS